MSSDPKIPNKILRRERELRGWTLQDVADRLYKLCEKESHKSNISADIVGRWERGVSIPQPHYQRKLCRLFGKSNTAELGFLDQHDVTETPPVPKTPPSIPGFSLHPSSAPMYEKIEATPQFDEQGQSSAYSLQVETVQSVPLGGEHNLNRRDFNRGMLTGTTALLTAHDFLDSELLDRFFRAIKKPSTIDEKTLIFLRKRTENYYRDRHDANFASSDVLSYALDHFRKATELLEEPLLPTIRLHLSSIAGEIAQLIGELHFELGKYARARTYHIAAIEAAREANNRALQSIAWGWMSFAWTYSRNEQKALACVQEARRLAEGSVNTTVRAWLAAVEAEIQANLDDLKACRKALDGAECIEDQKYSKEDSYWIHFDRSLLAGYQGICFLRLYRPNNAERTALLGNAQKSLSNALEQLDPTLMRRQPTYLADLASTHIRQGEVGEACERAIQAVAIAAQIKSRMVLQRLFDLRHELEPWKDTQNVKNLDEHLAPLLIPEWSRGNA